MWVGLPRGRYKAIKKQKMHLPDARGHLVLQLQLYNWAGATFSAQIT